jgi:hypothetical protein
MQDKHIFEYAIIRVVPRVEREEFLNVGVILYCPQKNFLKTKWELNKDKLSLFANGDLDVEDLEKRMNAFEQICDGTIEAGEIGRLPIASRFRWLTATRSTIVQTSPVHPGLCDNAEETLNKIYQELVK